MSEHLEIRRKRLLYQSWYRGTKETDLILGPFARDYVPKMAEDWLIRYEQFLNESDTDIYAWVTGAQPAPGFVDTEILGQLQLYWQTQQRETQ